MSERLDGSRGTDVPQIATTRNRGASVGASVNVPTVENGIGCAAPPEYGDVVEGKRRTLIYGLIELGSKTNPELENMMMMAERLKLSRLWTVCAEILEERHQSYLALEEARRAATMSRIQPGRGVRIATSQTGSRNQRVTFLAGARKRGKFKS